MGIAYSDWIKTNFISLPEGFQQRESQLLFHDIALADIIRDYGTPLKLTYLPLIGRNINKVRSWFFKTCKLSGFQGAYRYAFCLKSNPMAFVVREVLKNDADLEISSAFDAQIVFQLYTSGKIGPDRIIICNGFKTDNYFAGIKKLINAGMKRVIPVIDSAEELEIYGSWNLPLSVGIRMAVKEEAGSPKKTSRFGLNPQEAERVEKELRTQFPKITLEMLHFFVFSGINDTPYFWTAFQDLLTLFSRLKKHHPSLNLLNIGGGFPVTNHLGFEFDYEGIISTMVRRIMLESEQNDYAHPNIISEFGTFTVAESYCQLYKILEVKNQGSNEKWYLFDGSLMNAITDAWAMKKKFLVLPLNHWDSEASGVTLAGLTCDNVDYYDGDNTLVLPWAGKKDPLYIGFFNTGAYQEVLGGFNGVNHCLIPNPRHLLLDRDNSGNLVITEFNPVQSYDHVSNLLGY